MSDDSRDPHPQENRSQEAPLEEATASLKEAAASLHEAATSLQIARREVGTTLAKAGSGDDSLPDQQHLLTGYDRVRERILKAVARRGGKLGADTVRVLLLVPDIFLLLVRLVLDRDVPTGTRALIGSVLAYFIMPIDLLPEALVGGAGYLDDVVLATALLAQAFDGELEPYARKHWSGPEDIRIVLQDVTAAAHRLLGGKVHGRLQGLIGRLGLGKKAEEEPDQEN